MMPTFWDPARQQELEGRIARLTPASAARWGRMDVSRMVAHLADWMRMALGEIEVPLRNLPVRHPPLKQLLVYVVPFPKNLPTAPQLMRAPDAWERELADLRGAMARYAARGRHGVRPAHPAFGPLSERAWGVLAYRHTDHHLRQFGV